MAYEAAVFDPRDRSREKQAARERDERLLNEGRISRADLQRQNSMFSGFDLSNAVIARRSVRVAS